MKKERIKSIVLIALVISSLVLTGQIWFNEKLWPEGYNFFVNISNSAQTKLFKLFGVDEGENKAVHTSIASPTYLAAYMVRDFDHAITVVDQASPSYSVINDYVSDAILNAMSTDTKKITKVDEDAWRKALFTRGFYVDYGINYSTPTFLQIFGAATPAGAQNISAVRRFIITAEDTLVGDVSVYVADESESEFYKISTNLDKNVFNENLKILAPDATPKKRFSFFINADVPTGIAGEAIFAPYLILNEESVSRPVINSTNPILKDGEVGISMNMTEKLLKAFSINPRTAIKYVDADENIIYVQSKNTLKISPKGVLSYTTVEGGKGLSLEGVTHTSNAAQILSGTAGVVSKVCSTIINDESLQLYLDELTENQNYLKASFNYSYDGVPIIFGEEFEGRSAIEMEFEGGYLKSYRQILRRYEASEEMTLTEPTYDAKIFDSLSEEEKIQGIEKLFEAYDDDGSEGEKAASWFVKIKGTDGYKR